MENLYQVMNNFNTIFGHSGKLVAHFAEQSHLWLQIKYPLPVDDDKIKSQTEWCDAGISYCDRNNYGMCKIWIEQDKNDPKKRPKFILWNDAIYVNPYTMPDKELADAFFASRRQLFGCEAHVLVGKSEVFVSDKLMRQFMEMCREHINNCRSILCDSYKVNTIQEYAQRIVSYAETLRLLELEMKFREQEKQEKAA